MKAILMMNEMPNCCNNCVCYDGMEGRSYCNVLEENIEKCLERHNNCPLLEINDNIAKLIEVAR